MKRQRNKKVIKNKKNLDNILNDYDIKMDVLRDQVCYLLSKIDHLDIKKMNEQLNRLSEMVMNLDIQINGYE